jgi:hypothetical protein
MKLRIQRARQRRCKFSERQRLSGQQLREFAAALPPGDGIRRE